MKESLAKKWREEGIVRDERIIRAFLSVPREKFVLPGYEDKAYLDYPLPIPASQTISQPTTVMIMTQALEPKQGDKILEIGAGSGYQAAILSKLVGNKRKVISTEIISELVVFARNNLKRAGIKNVEVIAADGSRGYEKESPYDKIIVTAASPDVPKPLFEQLKENGIMIIPIGPAYSQEMWKLTKKHGKMQKEYLGDFMFVPLKGEFGHKD